MTMTEAARAAAEHVRCAPDCASHTAIIDLMDALKASLGQKTSGAAVAQTPCTCGAWQARTVLLAALSRLEAGATPETEDFLCCWGNDAHPPDHCADCSKQKPKWLLAENMIDATREAIAALRAISGTHTDYSEKGTNDYRRAHKSINALRNALAAVESTPKVAPALKWDGGLLMLQDTVSVGHVNELLTGQWFASIGRSSLPFSPKKPSFPTEQAARDAVYARAVALIRGES